MTRRNAFLAHDGSERAYGHDGSERYYDPDGRERAFGHELPYRYIVDTRKISLSCDDFNKIFFTDPNAWGMFYRVSKCILLPGTFSKGG